MARPYIVKTESYKAYFKSGRSAVMKYRELRNRGEMVMIGNRVNGWFIRSC